VVSCDVKGDIVKVLIWGGSIVLWLAAAALGLWLLLKPEPESNAHEPVAEVVSLRGRAFRRAFLTSSWIPLKVKDSILHRDEVKTDSNSKIRVVLLADGQELEFSENSMVEIKKRALQVSGGSVENQSSGSDNPFAISIGDVKVVLDSREGEVLRLQGGEVGYELLAKMWNDGAHLVPEKTRMEWNERVSSLENQGVEAWDLAWTELSKVLSEAQRKKQNVKISMDEKTGKVRAQVSEGTVRLELSGQVGTVDVKEGEGLIMDEGSSEVRRVKLLTAPLGLRPNGEKLYNLKELVLSWSPLEGAMSYKIQVSDDDIFSNILFENSTTENFVSMDSSSWLGGFYWRVWAVDVNEFEGAKSSATLDILEDKTPPKLLIEDIQL
jgi:hypothetical protein